jgi:serine/threonine-protein kinase
MPELKNSFSEGELVAGNYRVLAIAGSGGMGIVYRALDLRLERIVALKFLPPEVNINERDKERFLREARTASSLDHPNIGVIHGVEETAGGLTFIVMAFYEGASLAERIRRGPLSVHESIEIVSQMASGLTEAHSRGIVHRDIKPSNVMLSSSGLVKIVDFGLARVVSDETASQVGINGTVRYMSPEQAMGLQIDQRCDIWALGVVFAEMLTGDSPFPGDSIPSTLFAIMNSPPKNLGSVHPALQSVLYRALTKDLVRRYGSCAEFLADLKAGASRIPNTREQAADGAETIRPTPSHSSRPNAQARRAQADAARSAWMPTNPQRPQVMQWLLGAFALLAGLALVVWFVSPLHREALALLNRTPPEEHVAVLPFENVGSNPENAVLADGLMDSLAGRLSNLDAANQSLWIVPNSEVRKRNVTDPADALKTLGANLVIKGSVQRDGNHIRLTVNLIDARNLRQIGSAEVDDSAGDLSTLENEAVSRLARLLKIPATSETLRTDGGSTNPAAYEDYLTALGYIQRFDKPGNLDLATSSLTRAVQTDPNFALGYAQLGEAYRLKYQVSQDPHWLQEAQTRCQKAAELDNRIPAVFVTLAQIHDLLGKHDLALQEFHHALDLDPKNAAALGGLARSYEGSGRIADAEKTFLDAAALRPDDWYELNSLGAFYDRQSKYQQAIAAYQQALQITPDNAEVYSNLASAYIDDGSQQFRAAAEQALKKSIALNPSDSAYANLGLLYYQEKRFQEAATATEQALRISGNNYLVWNNLMLAYEALNQKDKAATTRRKAEALAEQAVALKPGDALAQSTLATFYAQDKLNQKAAARIRTSLALTPDDPGVLSNVAEAYELMGDREQALKYIEMALRNGYALDDIDPSLQALTADPRFKRPGK